MKRSLRTNRHRWVAVLLCSACGASDPAHVEPSGPLDGIGGTEPGSSDDTGVEAGAAFFDLGNADDGVDGGSDDCVDQPPLGQPIATDPGCATEPQLGTFNPVVEWTKSAWTENAASQQSVTTPIVVQLSDDDRDGDIDQHDMPDILYVTYDDGGMLRAISGDGSTEVLSVHNAAFVRTTLLAAADIDGDQVVEIVGIDSERRVTAYEHDGTLKWRSVSLGSDVGGNDSAAAISDMDGDGVPEIIAGRAIVDADGNVIAAGDHGIGTASYGGASMSFAVDLDDDGEQEVVVGNAAYRMDGTAVWFNGEPDGFPAVADLDRDGTAEIVVVITGGLRAQSAEDGTVLWTADIPGGHGGPPTIADYDGDGAPEIGVAGTSTYTVWDGDGTVLWSNQTQDGTSGITGSAVFDFEGDGVADVVYADETRLWVFAGNSGAVKLEFTEHSSKTRLEYPIVADVDGDGEVEIAFVNETYQAPNYRGLTVLGDADHSWRPGRKIWNQHAYHITNVDDDGTVPAVAAQNWKSFDNFRSGDSSVPDGLAIPGVALLVPASCDAACDGDVRTLWLQLGNDGAAVLASGVDVEVFGVGADGSETLLDTVAFTDPLPAGEVTDGVAVEVDASAFPTVRLSAVVHEIVCHADAASLEVAVPPCPASIG